MNQKKCYSELIQLPTFEERFEYLKCDGHIGIDTFGYDRYLNQMVYTSKRWRKLRNDLIIRDKGNDLGVDGYGDNNMIMLHHINPITKEDVLNDAPCVWDPNNLICCTKKTHNAIHYGSLDNLDNKVIERKPGDTCPWRK